MQGVLETEPLKGQKWAINKRLVIFLFFPVVKYALLPQNAYMEQTRWFLTWRPIYIKSHIDIYGLT
jgi:hypothetical protein